MCLRVQDRKIHTAEEDLPVYKLLEYTVGGVLCSPYFAAAWDKGETKTVDCFSGVQAPDSSFGGSRSTWQKVTFESELPPHIYSIDVGLHSYMTLEMAEFWQFSPRLVICLMVIPKGSKYVLGHNEEVVSTSLRLEKVL